jgi:adenosylmethionine-8-amino-7-oxononanoate aminotransferase
MTTKTLGKKPLTRAEEPYAIEVKKTQGDYLIDRHGKKYIDFVMGWCVGNIGWGNKEVTSAIRMYNGPDYVYPGLVYPPWNELAEMLTSLAPGKLEKCYRTTGGSEAVDAAMQIAMAYTGRNKFLSVEDAYHGNTIGSLSIGAVSNREKISGLLPGCLKIDLPLDEKAVHKLETRLKKKDIAAFILEPVLCNLGVHIPSQAFMKAARELCSQYGTLLVIDEVATGFGRTGKFLACEHYDLEPDILCIAKAVTGGYASLGAVITTKKIEEKVRDAVNIYSTYGWHPLSVAVAIANIKYLRKHWTKISGNIAEASQQFRTRLSQMDFKKKGTMNIIGLAISVNVGDSKYASLISEKCLRKGLFFTTQDEMLIMFPSLTIDKITIARAMDILEECL